MNMKEKCIQTLIETGVVAVIRVNDASELLDTTIALNKGGVKALEITMTSPGALDAINEASKKLGDEAIIGVGVCLIRRRQGWQSWLEQSCGGPVLTGRLSGCVRGTVFHVSRGLYPHGNHYRLGSRC